MNGERAWSLIREAAELREIETSKVMVYVDGVLPDIVAELQDIGYEYSEAHGFRKSIIERKHEEPDICGVCEEEIKSYEELVKHLGFKHGILVLPTPENFYIARSETDED